MPLSKAEIRSLEDQIASDQLFLREDDEARQALFVLAEKTRKPDTDMELTRLLINDTYDRVNTPVVKRLKSNRFRLDIAKGHTPITHLIDEAELYNLREVPIESLLPLENIRHPNENTIISLCPFHKESTPSFSISKDKNLAHCFGCQFGGDNIAVVRRYYKESFVEAIHRLRSTHACG